MGRSVEEIRNDITNGGTSLGIEFGSTRIKAVLVDSTTAPVAQGSYEWENRLENGIWTYSLEDIWKGLRSCYQDLAADVKKQYGVGLTRIGTRECQAYVEPCEFGEGKGFYDDHTIVPFSTMVHGFIYPDEWVCEEEKGKLIATFWTPVMKKGIITFIRPEQCAIRRIVGTGDIKRFEKDINFKSVEHEEGGELHELGE